MTKGTGFRRRISEEFYEGCTFRVMKANIFLNEINSGPQSILGPDISFIEQANAGTSKEEFLCGIKLHFLGK